MNAKLMSEIFGVLATMTGFPNWPPARADGQLNSMAQAYWTALHDLSDEVGLVVRNKVLLSFNDRPSVKSLRDWAVMQVSVPYKPKWLESPSNGMKRIEASEIETQPVPRAEAKRIMDDLRNRVQAKTEIGCGLQFKDRATGKVSRTGASRSEAQANADALARNTRWPHIETTVFQDESTPATERVYTVQRGDATKDFSRIIDAMNYRDMCAPDANARLLTERERLAAMAAKDGELNA